MNPKQPPPEIDIEPIPFRPDSASGKSLWMRWTALTKWIIAPFIGLVFLCLIGAAWFVFTAGQVVVDITPAPDRVSVAGGIFSPRMGGYYLLRPGRYSLHAEKTGYRALEAWFQVTDSKSQTLHYTLKKLPGRLTVIARRKAQPDMVVTGAVVYVDGIAIGTTPILSAPVEAGRRQIRVLAENYKAVEMVLDVKGMGEAQTLEAALVPGWAAVTVRSIPDGAAVHVDGQAKGKTPLEINLPEGVYDLRLSAARYKTVTMQLAVTANRPKVLETIRLVPQDGTLSLHTTPNGATVTVDGTYVGQTPITLPLVPDRKHVVRLSKAGYEQAAQTLKLASAEEKTMKVTLTPKTGIVHLSVAPADAALYIDGARRETIPDRLELIAVEHDLEVKKEGYIPHRIRITPRPGFPQELTVVLKPVSSRIKTLPPVITAADGYELRLVHPKPYRMGSSRREQGRRSNESLRRIVLKRPFYMGAREVTNKQLRAFLTRHDAGAFSTQSLNQNAQPAVRVTWKQAVQFCNWLSRKEGLEPVYTITGNTVAEADPMGTGYRLPTEAEWEYCARFRNKGALLKYPWGDRFPPENRTVNIADESAKDLLAEILASYDDGFPVTAPPGSFGANDLGLYDLGGNVSEWCHDYYAIYPYSAEKRFTDPSGPKQGVHHVVRGSSWRHAGISVLRAAYRGYSNTERPDLGFRICRYAE
jgi:formylglycine-generating enzyme required for sulfatase activity